MFKVAQTRFNTQGWVRVVKGEKKENRRGKKGREGVCQQQHTLSFGGKVLVSFRAVLLNFFKQSLPQLDRSFKLNYSRIDTSGFHLKC